MRGALNTKVIQVIEKRGLTHAQVAALAGTSRTRITALINRNTKDISTDLMLGRWSYLADKFVQLPGAPVRTRGEVIAFLKSRVQPVTSASAD